MLCWHITLARQREGHKELETWGDSTEINTSLWAATNQGEWQQNMAEGPSRAPQISHCRPSKVTANGCGGRPRASASHSFTRSEKHPLMLQGSPRLTSCFPPHFLDTAYVCVSRREWAVARQVMLCHRLHLSWSRAVICPRCSLFLCFPAIYSLCALMG